MGVWTTAGEAGVMGFGLLYSNGEKLGMGVRAEDFLFSVVEILCDLE